MFYLILTILIIFAYFVYKRQKSSVKSEEELMYIDHGSENIENWKRVLLERVRLREDFIQEKIDKGGDDLEDWLSALKRLKKEKTVLGHNAENFFRLKERFKHDKVKLIEITKDRVNYLQAKACLFHESPLFIFGTDEDTKKIEDEQKEYNVKIEEINKRFKEALGREYAE